MSLLSDPVASGAQVEAAEVFGVAFGDGVVEDGDLEAQASMELFGVFID